MKYVENEDLMFERHRRVSKSPEFTYEFTKDPGLLQQYYSLRNRVFERTHGVNFPPVADAFDKVSDILVVRVGNQVVGGTRMTFKAPNKNTLVSLQKYNIDLPNDLPELKLDQSGYCDASKMAILEEYQTIDIMKNLINLMYQHCHKRGYRYAFSMCPTLVYRLYRLNINRLGYLCNVCETIKFPANVDGVSGDGFKLMMFDVGKSFEPEKYSENKREMEAAD